MDKQKKELSRQIDGLIVSYAIGNGYDERSLLQLAIKYANDYDTIYKLSDANLRSLETAEEKKKALQMEEKVNAMIHMRRQVYSELGSKGSIFKNRKSIKRTASSSDSSKPRTPSPRTPSPRTPSPRTPSPRTSPKPCARRSYCNIQGGKHRTKKRRH